MRNLLCDVVADDTRAFARQRERGRASLSMGRTGDERNLSVKITRHNASNMLAPGLAILRPKCGNYRPMVGGEAPVRRGEHVGLNRVPFPRHAGAQEDIIDAAVGVIASEIVRPGYRHRIQARTAAPNIVAISFGGAS